MARAAPAPRAYRTQAAFRAWLATHHATARELTVRLFKAHARARGIGYGQALDEALCFGWIDGVRRRFDDDSFTQRFTPRRPRSTWSRANVAHVERLTREGRMAPAGLAAFTARDERRTGMDSFEQVKPGLAPSYLRAFRAQPAAWAFFQAQPAGYRRLVAHWVMSAKREETRARRFRVILDCSAAGQRLNLLAPYSGAAIPYAAHSSRAGP